MEQHCSEPRQRLSFAGGASALPPEVLAEVRDAIGEWNGCGQSILELAFTEHDFTAIQEEAEADLRALLALPGGYRVLFLAGGAFAQFRLVPLNLLAAGDGAAYVDTGLWSQRAIEEAACLSRVTIAARGRNHVPPVATWDIPADAAYCHITGNETADGVQFHQFPTLARAPLVADLTADLLTAPLTVERFGLIYASAQKNLGAAGLTLVILREDLLGKGREGIPAPLDYARQAAAASRVNTPPMFALFVAGRMLKWLRRQGGLEAAAERCRERSDLLYAAITASDLYRCPVAAPDRSQISVCFHLANPALEPEFLAQAARRGLWYLRGHPARGGLRACLYNAMPLATAAALADFMAEFAHTHRHDI